jgi:hypothetical protein
MSDLLLHTVHRILAWPAVDHIKTLDLDPDHRQHVEMPTETIRIRIEMSDEAIEDQLRATTASGPFLLAQGAEVHQAHSRQPMEAVMPLEIGPLPEEQTTMLNPYPSNLTLLV